MDAQEYDISTLLVIPLSQIIVGVVMGIALLNGEYALALLTLLLLCMMRGAKLWSRISGKNIIWKSGVDNARVFPGESLTFNTHVENSSWLPVWLRIGVVADAPFSPINADMTLTQESGLLWYQQADFQWTFTAQRRGVYSLGAASLRIGDLFGFFPYDQSLKDSQEIVVYPRLVPLTSLSLPRHDVWGNPGANHPICDPIYILGTREYHHSQPAKYIHWKASARYNRLHEKLFESSEQEKILLMVDVAQFATQHADDAFEHTLEVVASLGVRLIQQGYAVGCITNGRITGGRTAMLPISGAPRQAAALLELLARVEMKSSETLFDLLIRGIASAWGMSCLHVAFQYDEAAHAISGILRQRHIPATFVVSQFPDEDIQHVRGKVYTLKDVCREI